MNFGQYLGQLAQRTRNDPKLNPRQKEAKLELLSLILSEYARSEPSSSGWATYNLTFIFDHCNETIYRRDIAESYWIIDTRTPDGAALIPSPKWRWNGYNPENREGQIICEVLARVPSKTAQHNLNLLADDMVRRVWRIAHAEYRCQVACAWQKPSDTPADFIFGYVSEHACADCGRSEVNRDDAGLCERCAFTRDLAKRRGGQN